MKTVEILKNYYLQIIIVIFIIAITIQPSLDLDLGWHLRYGQYFFQTGHILKDNILSYVWPNYKWVQASWAYDLFVYQIFSHFGFLGVSISASLLTLVIFLILTHPLKRFNLPQLLFLLIIYLALVNQIYISGLRSQTPSTLFFTLTLVISMSYLNRHSGEHSDSRIFRLWTSQGDKLFYLLPLLFFLWANFHGGFSLGLIIISLIWISTGILRLIKPRPWLIFGAILLLSTLTPLINPYGIRIYEETFKHSTNINLSVINEWMPLTKSMPEAIIIFVIVVLTYLLAFYRRKVSDIPFLLGLTVAVYLAFSATRFIIVLGLFITFYFAQNLTSLKLKFLQKKGIKLGLTLLFIFLILFDLFVSRKFLPIPTTRVFGYSWKDHCEILMSCSEKITEIMLKDPPKGVGFNPYAMGGYLIYRVPQVKVFVDGRMAAWEENGRTPPILEVASLNSKDSPIIFRSLDSQYHFSWVIIETGSPIDNYLGKLAQNGIFQRRIKDVLYSYYIKTDSIQTKN